MKFQQVATAYAAAVGTISLIWNIARDGRDVGKLTVYSSVAVSNPAGENMVSTTSYKLGGPAQIPALPTGTRYFMISFTNVGRRPITVLSWSFSFNAGSGSSRSGTTFPEPLTLKESETFSFEIRDFNLLRGNVVGIVVKDSHGQTWSLPEAEISVMKAIMLEYHL